MAEEKKPAQELPKNAWGFAGLLVRMLGDRAPAIIITGGIIAAFYFFYQQQVAIQEKEDAARLQAEQLYKDRIERAQKELNNTTALIAQLSSSQISSVQNLLQLQTQASEKVKTLRTKADEETTRAAQARNELRDLQGKIDSLGQKGKDRADDVQKLKGQLAEAERRRKNAEKTITENARLIEDLKRKSVEMARAILEMESRVLGVSDLENHEALAQAREVEKTYFRGEVDPVVRALKEFAAHPKPETLTVLNDLFTGIRLDRFAALMKEDVGIDLWYKGTDPKTDGPGPESLTYIGVSAKNDEVIDLMIIVEVDKGTVESLYAGTRLFGVVTADPSDWLKNLAQIIVSDVEEGPIVLTFKPLGPDWSIRDIFIAVEGDVNVIPVDGVDRRFRFRDPAKLTGEDLKAFETLLQDDLEGLGEAMRMQKAALSYKAPLLPGVPDSLQKAFGGLLKAAVDRDVRSAQRYIEGKVSIGQVAAAALAGDFELVRVNPIRDEKAQDVQSVRGYEIYARYVDDFFDETYVRFDFAPGPAEGTWLLTAFSPNTVAPRRVVAPATRQSARPAGD